ncbi:hypothetical protein NC00_17365 [Xanthomonas cannabis pv. phaseoli]|uniref:Secreted protein n=1 Tax=Xanthomonas cannabis pv. phaseoli TaxID=1885902 RepID=A0AB34P4N4_9XANT|nr:hypothetical protein NC00_17365 [Xanthomonas cannabis pv. phaseoli]
MAAARSCGHFFCASVALRRPSRDGDVRGGGTATPITSTSAGDFPAPRANKAAFAGAGSIAALRRREAIKALI